MTQPGSAEPWQSRAREQTSLLVFLSILLRNRRVIAICGLVGLVAFGAFAMSEANLYIASGAFAARPSRSAGQVSEAATHIGLSLGVVDVAQSTLFYGELARSNSVLIPVAQRTYTVKTEKGTRSGPLAEFVGVKSSSPTAAAIIAANKLVDNVAVLTSGRSGVVTLLVTAEDPQIAQQITANILKELDSYSSSMKKQSAVAERKFVELLVTEARQKLSDAENRLASYRQQNRDLSSPSLRIRDDQLVRDADLAQQEYAGLESSYQQARIEEVRNLSAIRIVDYPDVPVQPQRREAARKTLIGFVTGIFAGIVIAFLRQRLEEKRRGKDTTLDQFANARRETSADARRLAGPFARSSAGQ